MNKDKRESYIKALSSIFGVPYTFIYSNLKKLSERPIEAVQIDLFRYDTG